MHWAIKVVQQRCDLIKIAGTFFFPPFCVQLKAKCYQCHQKPVPEVFKILQSLIPRHFFSGLHRTETAGIVCVLTVQEWYLQYIAES